MTGGLTKVWEVCGKTWQVPRRVHGGGSSGFGALIESA
jgi:hypothetical protein